MKRLVNALILLGLVIAPATVCAQGVQEYCFNHGPYLQELSNTGAFVYFTTSADGYSRVELCEEGSEDVTTHVTIDDGLIEAINTRNTIELKNLKPNTKYRYRLVSNEVKQFRLSRTIYGDTIRTDWFTFKTLNPAAKECTFLTTSDIHDDSAKYRKLLSYVPAQKTDMVFLLGDIMSHFSKEGQPYSSFIDVSVDEFAKEVPFVLLRGNHDTRGHLARTYDNYIHRQNGHFYGTYKIGDTFFILLDTGEDKPDDHHDYSGVTAFEQYRLEQQEWLKEVVKSKEFKSAKKRIVFTHMQPAKRPADATRVSVHGPDMVYNLYMPILNKAKVDLLVCGHTHRFSLIEVKPGEYNFPVIINDNNSISYFKVNADGVHVTTYNTKGEVTLDRTF